MTDKKFIPVFGRLGKSLASHGKVLPFAEWVLANNMVHDRGTLITFDDHMFLKQVYDDWSKEQAIIKASQLGFSIMMVLKVIYAAAFKGFNVIYTLPSGSDVKRFEGTKVSPVINGNAVVRRLVKSKPHELIERKSVGKNFIYFQGTITEQAALSVSSDLNVHDESDYSNQDVIDQYISRQAHSTFKGIWQFSNPSAPNIGASKAYENSDKKRWHIQCPKCKEVQTLDWPDSICFDRLCFQCKSCRQKLSDNDRRSGKWIAEVPGAPVSGYHLSQMLAPWIKAEEIVDVFKKRPTNVFYNFYLGLPYISDSFLDEGVLLNRRIEVDPEELEKYPCALGVDVGIRKFYVLGNELGIFKIGETNDWNVIENLIKTYKPVTVIDIKPDPTIPRQLAKQYNNVYLGCEVNGLKAVDNFVFVEKQTHKQVNIERSALIDEVIDAFINNKLALINLPSDKVRKYIDHWKSLYAVMEPDRNGEVKKQWRNSGADHYAHATSFFKAALSKVLFMGGGTISFDKQENNNIQSDFSLKDSYLSSANNKHWTTR